MSASLPCCELKWGVKSAWSKVLGWKENLGTEGCGGFPDGSVSCIRPSR